MSRSATKTTDCLRHAEDIISSKLTSALTNRDGPDKITRRVFFLPVRNCELTIKQSTKRVDYTRKFSESQNLSPQPIIQPRISRTRPNEERYAQRLPEDSDAEAKRKTIYAANPDLSYDLKLAREKGASYWTNVLPIKKHGLSLTKSEFPDALCIRKEWDFKNVPSTCSMLVTFFTVSRPKGQYPIIRHNEIRGLFASLISKVGHEVKPYLQLPDNEVFTNSNSTENESIFDISAKESRAVVLSTPSVMSRFSRPMLRQTPLKTPKMLIYYDRCSQPHHTQNS